MKKCRFRICLTFGILLLSSLQVAISQETRASLSGKVTAADQAVIQKAEIVVQSLETGVINTTETSSAGEWHVQYLVPGHYQFQVTARGFKALEQTVELQVGDQKIIDERLQVGSQELPSGNKWQLVWSDEFNGPDGSGVDPQKWTVITSGNGFGNDELEYYTGRPENLQQRGGNLVMEARQEPYTGADGISRNYTSARIESRGKFEQQYGRFEARMKLPLGKGLWPAFWLLGSDVKSRGWPACGEIDIMENIGNPSWVYGTLHGPGYSGSHGIQGHTLLPQGQAVNSEFHTYAVDWSPERLTFSIDGVVYQTRTPQELPKGTTWVYDHPFFLLLNLAVGGKWPGNPDEGTKLPQQMLIDYVRVYKR
jgi:beta-glucanase (GH16 family)